MGPPLPGCAIFKLTPVLWGGKDEMVSQLEKVNRQIYIYSRYIDIVDIDIVNLSYHSEDDSRYSSHNK